MKIRTLLCWVPNALTVTRFILGLLLPWSPERWQFGILLFAGFTDLIDGWIARRLQLSPSFGQLADPIADKTLILAAVFVLLREGWLPWWELVALISRDIVAVALSTVALAYGMGNWRRLKPRLSGKVATGGQVLALLALFWYRQPFPTIVWVAAALSFVSACDYAWQAILATRSPTATETHGQ